MLFDTLCQVSPRIYRRIHVPAEAGRRHFQNPIDVSIAQGIAHYHEIDIAGSSIAALGNRAVDEGGADLLSQGRKRFAQRLRKTYGFPRDTGKLSVDGRVWIGLVVLLCTNPLYRDQATLL